MTRARSSPFEPAGFFVMRSPLLPRTALAALAPDAAPPGDPVEHETWLTAQYARGARALRELVRRPDVREAILLASPSLDEAIDAWLAKPARPDPADPAIRRYVQRMASRCTPFGLFAGVSVGATGERTRLTVPGHAALRRHTRIDARFLRAVADAAGADPALRDDLVYVPSSTLYRTAGRIRYAEAHGGGEHRSYRLVAVEASEGVDLLLARAAGGARVAELGGALVEAFAPEVTREDADAFVAEVIAAQILVPRLAPALTGDEPVHAMLRELAAVAGPRGAHWHDGLARAQAMIAELDATRLGEPRSRYRAIFDQLHVLTPAIADRSLLQVDLIKPGAPLQLGRAVLDEVLRAIEALHRIARPQAGALAEFAERFRARYDDREVPLVDALDEETGIGFAANRAGVAAAPPLLAGLLPLSAAAPGPRAWTAQDEALLQRLEAAWRDGARTIELGDADLARLASPRPPDWPSGLAATIIVLGTPEAIEAGNFEVHLRAVAAPSAAALLGRFCHSAPDVARWTRALTEREQAAEPDAILAEIVHQPQDVMGNVASRPVLRDHEIVYLGASGAPADRRIAIDDLLVSERNGQIRLRSKRLGKQILPRLASAHNWAVGGAAIYSFLCALQTDRGTAGFYHWDWGPLAFTAFQPRVRIGRVIVSPARWRIDVAPLRTGKTVLARFAAVQALRARLALPRHIKLVQSDNELAVDLDDVVAVEAMLGALPAHGGLALITEQLATEDALAARGPDGAFDHELVVPFVRREPVKHPPIAAPASARRSALPGGDWLYLKLYGGPSTLERVLSEAVAPVVHGEVASGGVARWFFLRYADPDWHVRLRLRGAPAHLYGAVLPALERALRPYHADGALHRLALDTYEPEIERYGGPAGMELAEAIFEADSRALIDVMPRHPPDRPERWRLTLLGMHDLLDALGLDLDARLAFTRRTRDGFAVEHGAGVAARKALGIRFRHERAAIEALLIDRRDAGLGDALTVLDARRAALRGTAAVMRAAIESGAVTRPLEELASSYLHMWVNRAAHTAAREQEFALFDLLVRTYEGIKARGRG
jgi:thiopeptide-type bacteriocin biosynthesis protein